ncbi:P-loop containing nucleoside triphosphate hydrolase protein [Histomonas meleagridis]|uniref:P-loop containing nucleoside triphosphate hydrolase protein n=1 Tax=Histomonas meleagridis TaxID=135588 RepID=UPI00355ACB58|nr:P-loop containing nucleoside triphosphate hydrolase protein [Histomonas meleagridis]KAH0797497.1 P-loop containing nucleoside triphosphate hydrolase protein [Histomonas meleagridis]
MWENRVRCLCETFPGVFDGLLAGNDEDQIFQFIKSKILNENYWEEITKYFSPIILHLVSEICLDCVSDQNSNDLPVVILFSNLIYNFPSIEPLVHFFFSYKPAHASPHVREFEYLRSLFRIRSAIGDSLELKASFFIGLLDEQLPEDSSYYLTSLISIVQNLTEKEATSLISSKCQSDLQAQLFFTESQFISHKIEFVDFGPFSYETQFATSIEGVPFLRSLSSNQHSQITTTSPHAKYLALAMLTNKPVLVTGPAGSGKTTLIQQLASLAGVEVTSLHLGSAVDAKSLLGGYICGEVPGEFRWMDGPLTSAIRTNEKWIILEQIEEASSEVMAIISPLLSEKKLFIPGRSETIKAGYNMRIFATSFQQLESSLWSKIKVDFLEDDKLIEAILKKHPTVQVILDKIISSWKVCGLTYHELFRSCHRLEQFGLSPNKSVTNETYLAMYKTIVDTYTSHLSDIEKRLEYAIKIAEIWDLSRVEAEAYLLYDKPKLILNPFQIGSITLPFLNDPKPVTDFAPTFTSLHHMESVARAIDMSEPVLIIGETGTGKTTLVQFIASSIGAELTVINMHHQSDTLDILGGFKPVDLITLLQPIYDKFQILFKKSFSQEKNAQYLNLIDQKFGQKLWEQFLKGVVKASQNGLQKKNLNEDIKNEWKSLQTSALGFLSRNDFLVRDFAFGFVEGPLTTAYKEGKWILLDEVNLAPPETLLALAPIIDGYLTLPNGEIIKKHPNFRLFCCMNPATDVGKVNLPETLKHKFISIFTDETSSENDIKLILEQRKVNLQFHQIIYDFYTKAREMSKSVLVDGGGQRVLYSLRALTRAILYMNKAEPLFGPYRACYDALSMSFASPLSPESSERLLSVLNSMIQPIDKEIKKQEFQDLIEVEGFYLKKGPLPIKQRNDFILTPTAKHHLKLLAQAVFLRTSPILLQGPTSSGKTSIIEYLADITGHEFVRINNHEHTDMSEYIGGYSTSETGKFEFIDGALVRAIRNGSWVVLDELNLAPSDVLEALNRLLDQNNQLYVAETQTLINPAPSFMLFATQNPPGAYGGRKQLSRAFRGRFVEIHIDEIPPLELTNILIERCNTAPPFAKAMVQILLDLRRVRQFSQIFAGKHSFLTVRDLLRWAMRGPDTWQLVANEGFALLGERLRTKEERDIIQNTITKNCKIDINFNFQKPDIDDIDVVWTTGMIRSVGLLMKCVENKEPALLIGETGTGKTTSIQVISKLLNRNLRILNCHQHTETSDFIGAMRPSRNEDGKLFEWKDGSLVEAMKNGDIFLMDEISLAQDSALERLNSVLETGRTLAIAEKPEYEIVHAHENFFFVATMNPGGDYGKRELSPSLRNRFTEIWVPSIDSDEDLLEILSSNSTQEETKENVILFLKFVRFYTNLNKSLKNISLRDILQWIKFVDLRVSEGFSFNESYIHGAFMVFIDCISPNLRKECINFISDQLQIEITEFPHNVFYENDEMFIGSFKLPKGPLFDPNKTSKFIFNAPTTSQNLLRVGRAMQMNLPVLIEGPPGVGKTSLITSLGEILGFNVVRINLSEHTEMLDLVGSELPVEDEESGKFAWRDGAFLTALKNGDWVILDELNLASQSVLEGLNSCLDHRASLFIPELGCEFKCHPQFRIFGCQNPANEGHGRKSLPRSFLNRFIRVYVEELTSNDFEFIISNCYENINLELRQLMIKFMTKINELNLDFEFNLRDVFRFCELINNNITPQKALTLLFIYRIRTSIERNKVLNIAYEIFGKFDPNFTPFNISPNLIRIGDLIIERNGLYLPTNLIIHPTILPSIEAILTCSIMKWPGLIVGSTATSKSSITRLAAHIIGRKLVEFSMNSSVDTTELLGGFEQMDNHRCFEQLRSKIKLNDSISLSILESITTPEELYNFIITNATIFDEQIIKEANELIKRKNDPGRFEWVDGLLLQAMRNGWWIIIDNANLCPPAVLDRLNPLCEPGGYLTLNERGIVNDTIETIYPHENFRLFMTVDPHYGEISRAMRNRSIEIYLSNYQERQNDPLLIEECCSLGDDYGEEFYELIKKCEHQELMQLSSWNMISFSQFKKSTKVIQLGLDSVNFNIVTCYGNNNDEENNDEPQQCEGTDGIGLGEGKGDEDITNEIEDEDQLIGDNVNTNKDQQTEEDVNEEGGFEVEPEFEGGADINAQEEEEQMDDEMGDANTDEAMESRETKDDSKEADKEGELDTQNKEEKLNGDEESNGNSDIDDEDNKKKPNESEMELEEVEEDQFESDAAQWNENPEEIKMDIDDDRMIENNSEGNEEEEISDEVIEELPPDIEDEKDEFLGKTAPDKHNIENEEDECEDMEMEGEGKGEAPGEGTEGSGSDENENNEEEEDKKEENENDKLKDIEKELQIVERKLLNKNKKLKEGGEGGQIDNDTNEGIILPADEAEEHDPEKEVQENYEEKDNENEDKELNEENTTNIEADEYMTVERDTEGFTHIKFESLPNNQINNGNIYHNEFNVLPRTNITEEGRIRWQNVVNNTRESSADLCEQLRLILESTVSTKMRGDFRTGKRLNMRKIIPFIASGFRKDKIWMRRIQPDQRNYQIMLCIDNSLSMQDGVGELALQSVCLIIQSLTLLGIGELSVIKFGDVIEIVHQFGEQWNDETGSLMMDAFKFDEEKTKVDELLRALIDYLNDKKKNNAMQIVFIISDGLFSNKESVKDLVIQAQLQNILIVFVIIDIQNKEERSSILDMRSLAMVNGKPVVTQYLDDFPFPFYVLINNPNTLPIHLADALRQWFDLANNQ